jgi:2-polyprenyl-6-methoxyphenol hydroxylase-like FAD-dependent oxidoreductase
MAGLTLAARLCQQGRAPVIVERASSIEGGYSLGLYPLGSCVLHGLNTYERLVERAIPLKRYELASGSGRVLQAFDLSILTGAGGPLLMISRSDLVRLLEASCTDADLRRGVIVSSLVQYPDAAEVSFDNGTIERFDVVFGSTASARQTGSGFSAGQQGTTQVGCCGLGGPTLNGSSPPNVAREWWGAGRLFGAYPVPGQVMCAAGAY